MSIRFQCPGCNVKLSIKSEKAGSVIDCPKCKARVKVPEEPAILEGLPLPAESSNIPKPEPTEIYYPSSSDDFSNEEDDYPQRRHSSNTLPIFLIVGLTLAIFIGIGLIFYKISSDKQPTPVAKKEVKSSKAQMSPTSQQTDSEPVEKPLYREKPVERDHTDGAILGFGFFSFFICVGISALGLLILNILIMVWIVRDARNRSLEGDVMWMIASLLFGCIVWIIYLASRPPGTLVPCDRCSNRRLHYVKICPHCGWETQEAIA